jgi:hypothetical protein
LPRRRIPGFGCGHRDLLGSARRGDVNCSESVLPRVGTNPVYRSSAGSTIRSNAAR